MLQDYEIAKTELQDAYAAICKRLNMTATITGGGLTKDDTGWQHRAYSVQFSHWYGSQTFPWMAGTGVKGQPNPAEVLAYCCRDFGSADCTFDDFCSEYGYDSDSRKAEGVYFACQEMGPKLQNLRITRQEIAQLAELANRL